MANTFPLSVVLSAVDRLSGPLGKMGGKLGRFGSKATQAGKALSFGLTLPILAVGASTVATATEFESSMLRVKALTSATAEQFAGLNAQARQLGKTTQFSAGQAGDAMGFLAQAGFDVGEVIGGVPEVLNLAAAAEMEMGRSAEIAAIILRGYGKDVGELRGVTNLLVGTTTKSTQTLEEFFEAMKLAGPLAHGFGFEMSETAAILGKFADGGFQASLGGTAFRASLAALMQPSAAARQVLAKLQLPKSAFFDAEGGILSLRNAVVQLNAAGASAEDVFQIFGKRAGGAMISLVGGGAAAIDDLRGKIDGAGDIAERVGKEKMSGFRGEMLRMVSAFKELQITIAQSGLIAWLTGVAQGLTRLSNRLAEADPKTLALGLKIAGVAAILGPFFIALGLVSSGIGAIVTGVGFLLPALKFVALALVRTVIPAIWSFTVALLSNPIGLVVASIAALIGIIVLLATHAKEVGQFFVGIWEWVKGRVFAVFGAIGDGIRGFLDFVPDWLIDLLGGGSSSAVVVGSVSTQVDGSRLANSNSAGIGQGGQGGSASVRVDLNGLPPNATVTTDPANDVDLELGLGFAMESF